VEVFGLLRKLRPLICYSTILGPFESVVASEESAFECFCALLFGERAGSLSVVESEQVERLVMVDS
jgi:hypothetical protein